MRESYVEVSREIQSVGEKAPAPTLRWPDHRLFLFRSFRLVGDASASGDIRAGDGQNARPGSFLALPV